jgi:hypothetical protein
MGKFLVSVWNTSIVNKNYVLNDLSEGILLVKTVKVH